MMNADQSECLGCVYVFSPAADWFAAAPVIALGPDSWSDYDAMVAFWVRTSRLAEGLDRLLLDSLVDWFDEAWGVEAAVFFTNEQFDQQVAMIESAGLHPRFEAKLPGDEGKYLFYA